ncbi:MAG: acetoacetate decarboxylase family protein [Henriciella sp.]|nr:acetoacetate decarboxylase family protein [Henriciella sp.]
MARPPKYIDPTLKVFGRPPYLGEDALLQGGWMESSRGAIQSYLDRTINRVAPDKFRAKCVLSRLLMTSLFVKKMRSSHPTGRVWGYVPEADISIWALVYAGPMDRSSDWNLYWVPIYMFVDDPAAVAGGREIFGFPKMFGQIARSIADPADYGLSVSVSAFRSFGSDVEAEQVEILKIDSGLQTCTDCEIDQVMTGLDEMPDDPEVQTLFSGLRPPQLDFPVLQIKQFPSVENADNAAYQAIVSVKMTTTKLHGIGLAEGTPRLKIQSPLALNSSEELDTPAEQDLRFCFWVRQDFSTNPGEILYAASSLDIGV